MPTSPQSSQSKFRGTPQDLKAKHSVRLATLATRIGARGKFLQRYMARQSLGGAEKMIHKANRARIKKAFPDMESLLVPYMVKLPLKVCNVRYGKLGETIEEEIPCILPWDVVAIWQKKGDHCVDKTLCGSTGAAATRYRKDYWNNAKALQWHKQHPISGVPEESWDTIYANHWFLDETKTFNSYGQDACFLIVSWSGTGAKGVSRKVKHFMRQVPSWRIVERTNEELARFVA